MGKGKAGGGSVPMDFSCRTPNDISNFDFKFLFFGSDNAVTADDDKNLVIGMPVEFVADAFGKMHVINT